jgi:DNA-binding MarR family transcriptional regulator
MTIPEDERAALMTDLMRGVLKMSAISHRAGTAMNREAGLTNARWILIDQAAEQPEPLTLSEHARRLGFSRQAIRRLTAEMEKDGLIELVADPTDKRALTLNLTESGRRLAQEALERGMAYNRAISEQVHPQLLRQALDTITRLTEAMLDLERSRD